MTSISLGVGHRKFIEFFRWCHISLTFDVSCFLALVSVHLKMQVTFSSSDKEASIECRSGWQFQVWGRDPVVPQLKSSSGYEAMKAGGVHNTNSRPSSECPWVGRG